VATGVVVGRILLAGDHVLGVEKGSVGTGADLVDDVGLQIGVDGTRDVLALACGWLAMIFVIVISRRRTSLGEESAEAMVVVLGLALLRQVTIGLDAVLEAVELSSCQRKFAQWRSGTRYWPPVGVLGAILKGPAVRVCVKRTSQHEFAIWQPAWPTRRVQSQYQQIPRVGPLKAVKRVSVWGRRTVQADDFSHGGG
jgi:hypothetical protein